MSGHGNIARFNLLGALEVWTGAERVALGGPRTERVFAALLLEAGRVVPRDRLVRVLWDEDPPRTSVHQVRKSVAEIRSRIPAQLARIETETHGYRLQLGTARVDVHAFEELTREAHGAAGRGDSVLAATHLLAALGLWRGCALEGLGGAILNAAASALQEKRLSAEEWLCELLLARGDVALAVPRLRLLVDAAPLRESLRRLLIQALYQSGRKAEALEEYGRIRELLADELGVDPGTELTRLYSAILLDEPDAESSPPASEASSAPPSTPPAPSLPRHAGVVPPPPAPQFPAPTLVPAPAPASAPAPSAASSTDPAPGEARQQQQQQQQQPAACPAALPYDLDDFTGRGDEVSMLTRAVHGSGLANHLVAVDGMGGSGKTALAVHAAHRLSPLFPDGQLFVDLHGFTAGCEPKRPEAVLDLLLHSLGISAEQNPDSLDGRSAAWRTACTTRKLLIVLDNARDEAQIRPLLPAAPGCLVLVTSRRRLVNLDGAQHLSLSRLSGAEGFAMVERIIGAQRAATEPEAVAELVRKCGGLPLALRIAAARLRHRRQWTVAHLVGRLSAGPENLEELNAGDRSVADSLHLSFLALGAKQRRAFRLLGVHPGQDIDVYAAAALLGCGLSAADRLLEGLLDVNLLEQHELGRFGFHDLVRDFARGLARDEEADEGRLALGELLAYYCAAAEQAANVLFPARIRYPFDAADKEPWLPPTGTAELALAWFGREHANLTAVVRTAAREGHHRLAAYIPRNFGAYLTLKEFPDELVEISEISVAAARLSEDQQLLRICLTNAGLGHWLTGGYGEAIKLMDEALQLAVDIGDTHGQAACLSRLGSFHNSLGRPVTALRYLRHALALQRELCDLREEAMAHNGVSATLNVLCRHEEAAVAAAEALELNQRLGFPDGQALAQLNYAEALLGAGDWEGALERLAAAREVYERMNHAGLAALVGAWQAYGLHRSGRADQALETAEHTRRLALDTGSPARRATIGNLLGRVYLAAGRLRPAEAQYGEAMRYARTVGDDFELALAFDGAAAVSRAHGDEAPAEAYTGQAARLFERVGTPMCCRRLPG